ncbi:histone H1-like [Amaranthus tricolor]|uniref:histone H1-like n=1 Tax=Amaranthus tricolor TaxID=29722 RepID=UPI00258D3DAC|nr:histone H1-like [Amaranthus tricolor]
MAAAQASKSVKKAPAPKKSTAKTSPSHPPYIDMITEALVSLKEKTGSSHYAIAKHIEEQQKVKDLPPNFKKILFNQIKKFVSSGKLIKVKNSFKLPAKSSTAPVAAEKPKPKPKAAEKPKSKPAKKLASGAAAKPAKKQKVAVKVAVKVTKSPAKKVAAVKAKKPKSIKSPAKKATAVKKTTPTKKTKK